MQNQAAKSPHRQVFREEIRNAIREEIFSGKLKPGDRIIETFWAKEMGVSQGPVREAIRDLEAIGLVETVPFKGSRVRIMGEKEFQDNYSVRICLESKSIRDVITKLSDVQLSALVDYLSEILVKMGACAAVSDLQSFTDYDAAFHRAIIEATENSVLLKMWEQCNIRMWFQFSELTNTASLKQLQDGHRVILQAIASRDLIAATSMLEQHLTGIMNDFILSQEH